MDKKPDEQEARWSGGTTINTYLWLLIFVLVGVGLTVKWVRDAGSNTRLFQARTAIRPSSKLPYVAIAKGRVDVEGSVIQLAANRDGIINRVYVEEGDAVKQGQVLATQEDREARLSLALQRSRVEEARAEFPVLHQRLAAAQRERARLAPLGQTNSTSRQTIDRSRDRVEEINAKLKKAEATLKTALARESLAEHEVAQRVIRAPMDGHIVRRMARPGDGASTLSVTPLFWFVPDTDRIVRAEMDERFVKNVRLGGQAEIVAEADEHQVYAAEVLRIGKLFGPKRPYADDPQERVDEKVVECILKLKQQQVLLKQQLLVGQRVLVKFK